MEVENGLVHRAAGSRAVDILTRNTALQVGQDMSKQLAPKAVPQQSREYIDEFPADAAVVKPWPLQKSRFLHGRTDNCRSVGGRSARKAEGPLHI